MEVITQTFSVVEVAVSESSYFDWVWFSSNKADLLKVDCLRVDEFWFSLPADR